MMEVLDTKRRKEEAWSEGKVIGRWGAAETELIMSEELGEHERLLGKVISSGVAGYVEIREEIKALGRLIKEKREQVRKLGDMIRRLEGFIAKYGDEERESSIKLLKMRIGWEESDIKRCEDRKAKLMEIKGQMKDALIECGIILKEW